MRCVKNLSHLDIATFLHINIAQYDDVQFLMALFSADIKLANTQRIFRLFGAHRIIKRKVCSYLAGQLLPLCVDTCALCYLRLHIPDPDYFARPLWCG